MQLPLQISFRHMEHSAPLETLIRERAANLDSFADDIMSSRVVVGPANQRHSAPDLLVDRGLKEVLPQFR